MCYYDELPAKTDVARGSFGGVRVDQNADEPYILVTGCYSDVYGRKYEDFKVFLSKNCLYEGEDLFCQVWDCGLKKVYVCPSRSVYRPSRAWIE